MHVVFRIIYRAALFYSKITGIFGLLYSFGIPTFTKNILSIIVTENSKDNYFTHNN